MTLNFLVTTLKKGNEINFTNLFNPIDLKDLKKMSFQYVINFLNYNEIFHILVFLLNLQNPVCIL